LGKDYRGRKLDYLTLGIPFHKKTNAKNTPIKKSFKFIVIKKTKQSSLNYCKKNRHF